MVRVRRVLVLVDSGWVCVRCLISLACSPLFRSTIRDPNSSKGMPQTVTSSILNGPPPHSFHFSPMQPFLRKRMWNEAVASHHLRSLKKITSSNISNRRTALGRLIMSFSLFHLMVCVRTFLYVCL